MNNSIILVNDCVGHLCDTRHPRHQWAFVSHRELQRDLLGAVYRLYARLGLGLRVGAVGGEDAPSIAFLSRLQLEQTRTNEYSSKHVHSVQECCGMSETEVCGVQQI